VVPWCLAAGSFLQGGLFGLAGVMPATYTQAVMSGNGIGGVVVALLNIATLACNDVTTSAAIFFAISVAIILACIVSYYSLLRLPIVQHYVKLSERSHVPLLAENSAARSEKTSLWGTFHQIRLLAFLVGFNFLVTLAIFPGITAAIASVRCRIKQVRYPHTQLTMGTPPAIRRQTRLWVPLFRASLLLFGL
jgi:equilibrative nucleoside transporter 1/2/3